MRTVTVLLCLGIASAAYGEPTKKPFRQDRISPQKIDSAGLSRRPDDFDRKLALSRRLMRLRQNQQAADLLESLDQATPNHPVIQNLLRSCYSSLKQYTKAEDLARKVLEHSPKNHSYLLYLAEMLAEQDKKSEALKTYGRAMSILSAFDAARYGQIIASMKEHWLESEALNVIDSIRMLTGEAYLFASERGSILERQRRYREAAAEYIPLLLEDTTITAGAAEKRLMALLAFAESAAEVEDLLLRESDNMTGIRAARLLAAHYLKVGQFDQAYGFSLRQDSLQNFRGTALFQFMNQCQERSTFAPMLKMAEYMSENDSLFRNQIRVQFSRAKALSGLGRFSEALTVYQRLLLTAPTSADSAEAMYAVGRIYMDELRDYENALVYLDSVTSHHRRGRVYIQALMATPQCQLRSGDISAAKKNLSDLQIRISGDDIREEIDYYLAMIDLFSGKFDSAQVRLRKLMVDYPRGFFVNDALQIVLLLGEAEGADDLLADFSRALYFRIRVQPDSSRYYFARLAAAENKALADVALYRAARIDLETGDTTRAMLTLNQLIDNYPESYYQAFGMKMTADILVESNKDIEAGLALYQSLLENHSNYPFISDVRKKLRKLKEERPVG